MKSLRGCNVTDRYEMYSDNSCMDMHTMDTLRMDKVCQILNAHYRCIDRQSTASMRQAEQIAELKKLHEENLGVIRVNSIRAMELSDQLKDARKEMSKLKEAQHER